MESFRDFKLNKQLFNAIDELKYESPTPIQQKAIPLALSGHDVLGIAQTGTGKTAAYLLPILMKTKYANGQHPRALILAPTRELAIQIDTNITELGKYTDLRHTVLYGGVGLKSQEEEVKKGLDIVVATPGRFLDHYRSGCLVTKSLNTLVLDEADKMMDMGFMPQIREILEKIPHKRQNLLFSATFPEKVEFLSQEFLEFPEKIEVTPQATKAETVEHYFYEVPNMQTKAHLLELLLRDEFFEKVIVFVRTKETANNLFSYIDRKIEGGVRVIHSNKAQKSRINAIKDFSAGLVRVMVTTDVTARGHDITGISHVINFEAPVVYEDYVHRIGRTGRAYNNGVAITFANKADRWHLDRIAKLINEEIPERQVPSELHIYDTPFEESQKMEREIDLIKRKENPDFKGAFHEKKARPKKKYSKKPKNKRRR